MGFEPRQSGFRRFKLFTSRFFGLSGGSVSVWVSWCVCLSAQLPEKEEGQEPALGKTPFPLPQSALHLDTGEEWMEGEVLAQNTSTAGVAGGEKTAQIPGMTLDKVTQPSPALCLRTLEVTRECQSPGPPDHCSPLLASLLL